MDQEKNIKTCLNSETSRCQVWTEGMMIIIIGSIDKQEETTNQKKN